MGDLEFRKSGDSSVPGPKETLVETFRFWRRKSGGPDKEIDLRNEIIGRNLAKVLFEDSYNGFEVFLDHSGVCSEDQAGIKKLVFDELVREQSLGDMSALATAISVVLGKFFSSADVVQVIQAMEITYQKQVVEQYPPGIPRPVPKIDALDKLPQLILGFLEAEELV